MTAAAGSGDNHEDVTAKPYRVDAGVIVEEEGRAYLCEDAWDELINREDLSQYLRTLLDGAGLPAVGADTVCGRMRLRSGR